MKNYLSTFLIIFYSGLIFAQHADLTPVSDIGTRVVTVNVPEQFDGSFPEGKTLRIPENYTVSVFRAGGLDKPRFMAFSPGGILHVSDMSAGKIFAMPDVDDDGIADEMIEVASGFSGNHDVKFYKGSMYVTEPRRIWKLTDNDQDGIYETKTIFIDDIGNSKGGHTTRSIVFDEANQKVYVSIGSSCNVCREEDRAIMEEYNEDGTGGRVFASGIRNAVGLTLHPTTNRLWANNNGSDQQGNEIPPEWIDIVRDNGFYGHPFAYGGGLWFNFDANNDYKALKPITQTDSARVATLVQPAALIRAHSAPMALQFLNSDFGSEMENGFITALRGSWNTTNPNDFRGYKVIYGHLSSPQDTTVDYVSDFVSGFITDTINREFWGRPVGIAIDDSGKVYISSDEGNKFILVLTPNEVSGVKGQNNLLNDVTIFPNPAEGEFTLSMNLARSMTLDIHITDVFGKPVMTLKRELGDGKHNEQINIKDLVPGNYFVKISSDQHTITKKLVIVR